MIEGEYRRGDRESGFGEKCFGGKHNLADAQGTGINRF